MNRHRSLREARVEAFFTRRVKEAGGMVRKLVTPGRRHAPDRMVIWPHGGLDFVELKKAGEPPRPGQLREHARLRNFGQRVYVLDSKEAIDLYIYGRVGL